ncbi:igLON family member 5-like [Micropterus dolomieu]|uniref:igLON family member 5-like n=1 Tax=Micropterus dolomieu TaxID=147949 RepID=UPI001E8DE71A|nr:igLON family member 5-like [Micropterus dolomieu]
MKTIMWFWFVLGALSATGTVIVTKSGRMARIRCGVSSFSYKLMWRHRGNFIVENNLRGLLRRGTVDITKRLILKKETDLEIFGVKEEDAGQFTCVVDGTSHEHTLLVVSVWASPSGDLLLGSEATLQCQVKGLDQGSTVQWKRPDGSAYGESHTAQLRPVDRSYAGTWKCMFSFGGKEYNESLHISVKEPAPTTSEPVTSKGSKDIWASPSGDLLLGSEATLQCQVKGLDQGSTVQWKRPDGSAYGESHTAQLRPVDRSYAGTWKCMFSFGGKEYNESLHISVKEPAPTTSEPVTSKGSKDICNPTCPNCTTPSAAQLLGLNWLLWVTVGVVVLLVCVIVLCKRIRRRKSVMDQAVNWIRAAPNDYFFQLVD